MLNEDGRQVRGVHLSELWPFPREKVVRALQDAERIINVEANYTGQLARLLRAETGIAVAGSILKYDGRCFTPDEVVERFGKVVQ